MNKFKNFTNSTGAFVKKHWAKLGCAVLATSTIITSMGWAGVFEKAETADVQELEDGYYDILHVLNKQHNNKVLDIIDVTASTKNETEGVVKVYATAITAKGKEYVGSFSFTGEIEDSKIISDYSNEIHNQVSENAESNDELVQTIIDYVNAVADFVEVNQKTCEFVQEDLSTNVLQEVKTSQDGTTSTSNYSEAGVINRYYEYLGQKGISAKEEQDALYENTKQNLSNQNFITSFKVNLEDQTAFVITNVKNLTLRLTIDISSLINSTSTEEIDAQVADFILKFLKANTIEARDSLDLILKAETIDISSSTVWTTINDLTNASLAAPEYTLEQ